MWVPAELNSFIDYRAMRPLEQVETVTPDLLQGDALIWHDSSGGSMAPHGSTVDLGTADRTTNETFLIGVLAGLVPGIGWSAARILLFLSRSGRR